MVVGKYGESSVRWPPFWGSFPSFGSFGIATKGCKGRNGRGQSCFRGAPGLASCAFCFRRDEAVILPRTQTSVIFGVRGVPSFDSVGRAFQDRPSLPLHTPSFLFVFCPSVFRPFRPLHPPSCHPILHDCLQSALRRFVTTIINTAYHPHTVRTPFWLCS